MVQIRYDELRSTFERILATRGMAAGRAHACATLFADTTRDGVVTLHGEARDMAEKDLVSRIALDNQGVTRVENKMTLRQP